VRNLLAGQLTPSIWQLETHFISFQFINKPAKKSFEFPANATATPIAVSGVNKKKPPKRQKYF